MENYKKLEHPTIDQKQRALVELEREHGIPKCESISSWIIYDKRNYPGKTRKEKDSEFSPVSWKQADQMAEDSIGDFSDWLYSDKGFLIVTDKEGKHASPGLQGFLTYYRYCGFRRNVWRRLASTPKPNSKPLGENNLAKKGKELRDKYSKHLDCYRVDHTGMPIATLAQSYYRDSTDDETPASYYFKSDPQVESMPMPRQAGWMTTRFESMRVDNRIGIEDIHNDHEWIAIGRARMGV